MIKHKNTMEMKIIKIIKQLHCIYVSCVKNSLYIILSIIQVSLYIYDIVSYTDSLSK
jgi:hypothetical protein